MTHSIGIDFISTLGLEPVPFITLAAELGVSHISMGFTPITANPHDYPAWTLRDNPALRRDLVIALHDQGVTLSLGEGFLILPGKDIKDAEADMAIMQEIGAPIVNIVNIEPDWSRAIDQLAAFADLAAAHGMIATLEMMPGLLIGDLPTAVKAVREAARPNLRLLLDSMHIFRSGATAADIAALDPALIGYAQLCDVPLVSKHESYGEEARHNRLPPGEGELPLKDFCNALPQDMLLGLEIPMMAAAQAGVGPKERLARCIAATRTLLT